MIDDQMDDYAPDAYQKTSKAETEKVRVQITSKDEMEEANRAFEALAAAYDTVPAFDIVKGYMMTKKEFNDALLAAIVVTEQAAREREAVLGKKYARSRHKVAELKKHLKNTTRLLVLERGWLHDAFRRASDARKELAEEREKQKNPQRAKANDTVLVRQRRGWFGWRFYD